MATTSIPVHRLTSAEADDVRVERIRPAEADVRNDVHRHDFHELFVLSAGTGAHMIDLEVLPLAPPCVHAVAPGQVHQLTRSAATTGAVVMFSAAAWTKHSRSASVAALFQGAVEQAAFPLTSAALAEANTLIGLLENELSRGTDALPEAVNGLLGVLLAKVARWKEQHGAGASSSPERTGPVQRFLRAVDEHYLEQRQVSAYARDLGLSAGHLNELVRKHLGKSAGMVIQERVLLEAKRLLLHADLNVKEVSYALHMQDPAYFNRFFKKATGCTPVEFRTAIRGKYKP